MKRRFASAAIITAIFIGALFLTGCEGDPPPAQTAGAIVIDFAATWNNLLGDVRYICVYGWTVNPLVEFYIIESWGNYNSGSGSRGAPLPPIGVPQNTHQGGNHRTYWGTLTDNGSIYDVFTAMRWNQPSILGYRDFLQIFSVRRNERTEGIIDVSNHFEAWKELGIVNHLGEPFNADGANLREVALCIEAFTNPVGSQWGYRTRGNATVTRNILYLNGERIPTTPAGTNPGQLGSLSRHADRFNGYDFEFWTDAQNGGTGATMTLIDDPENGGVFTASWDSNNAIRQGGGTGSYNILFRMGRRWP